ncbi:MAG TPA: Fe-S protein assembly co-chaperone HscB [Herbaspirillum sp.]|jgi:molecular chaperone HscB
MQNHFELFHLPERFTVDPAALEKAYHEVQNQAHPDKFTQASGAEKRVAMQWATRANEAYKTLKNPFKRAAYLCELNGIDLQIESNTSMPRDFLMQQMEWREELDDAKAAKDLDALETLQKTVREARKAEIADTGELLDAGDYPTAALNVRKLMFLEKFNAEIGDVFALIEA